MTARLQSLQATMAAMLTHKLADDTTSAAVTMDLWTSLSNEAYLSFTASYVARDWALTTQVLSTVPLAEQHMQTVIAEQTGGISDQWDITTKISACMHDGTANVRDVGQHNCWSDVTCAAHKLQLCVQSSMGTDKVTSNPIAKCVAAASRLVGHFAHSPMATTIHP